jgi:hypothetical protein
MQRTARLRVIAAWFERENTVIDIVYIQPLMALVFGILILFFPRILNYLIAVYLIIVGILGLWPHLVIHVAR